MRDPSGSARGASCSGPGSTDLTNELDGVRFLNDTDPGRDSRRGPETPKSFGALSSTIRASLIVPTVGLKVKKLVLSFAMSTPLLTPARLLRSAYLWVHGLELPGFGRGRLAAATRLSGQTRRVGSLGDNAIQRSSLRPSGQAAETYPLAINDAWPPRGRNRLSLVELE